jgi:hypothetical protein
VASAFTPGEVWDCKVTLPEGRNHILYNDTEQSHYAFHRVMNRTKAHIGLDNLPRRITGLMLRKFGPEVLMELIEYAIIKDPEIGMVIIDGFLDLCRNYNNENDAFTVITWLKHITAKFNILVVGVIHQSKKEAYSLGHLGSAIDRYAESVLLIEKDQSKKFLTMSAQLLRNTIDEFPPVTVQFNGVDFEKSTINIKAIKQQPESKGPFDYTATEHSYMLNEILPSSGASYDDLIQGIYELKAVSKIKARAFVKYWREKGMVFQDKDKIYFRREDSRLFIVKEK